MDTDTDTTTTGTRYRDSMVHALTIAAIYTPAGTPITDPRAIHAAHCTSCK